MERIFIDFDAEDPRSPTGSQPQGRAPTPAPAASAATGGSAGGGAAAAAGVSYEKRLADIQELRQRIEQAARLKAQVGQRVAWGSGRGLLARKSRGAACWRPRPGPQAAR